MTVFVCACLFKVGPCTWRKQRRSSFFPSNTKGHSLWNFPLNINQQAGTRYQLTKRRALVWFAQRGSASQRCGAVPERHSRPRERRRRRIIRGRCEPETKSHPLVVGSLVLYARFIPTVPQGNASCSVFSFFLRLPGCDTIPPWKRDNNRPGVFLGPRCSAPFWVDSFAGIPAGADSKRPRGGAGGRRSGKFFFGFRREMAPYTGRLKKKMGAQA